MKYVGSSLPIQDAAEKAAGRARYAGDLSFPGMAHIAMVWSAVPHGIIESIDDSRARALNGVYGVFHCFNTTQKPFNRYRTQYKQSCPEQERVFNRQVRFIGDRVAAVAASTPELAARAAKLVKVDYTLLPAAVTTAEAKAGKNSCIFPEGAVFGEMDVTYGETPKAEAGDVQVQTLGHLSRISHTAMEPHVCVADCTGSGELTVYSPNQSVFGIRTVLSELLELPYNHVRVIKATMGGSFGGKQEWMLEPVAAIAAYALRRPVKLVFQRSEVFLSTICRGPMDARTTGVFSKEGVLKSFDLDVELDAGGYVTNSIDYIGAMSSKLFRTYRYSEAHFTARAVCTNTPVSGAYRGWSAPELCTFLEQNMNTAARRLGMDPLELRLKNVALAGEEDKKLHLSLGELHTKECLLLGRERFSWDQKRAEDRAFNEKKGRFRRGTAVASGGHVSTYFPRFPDYGTASLSMAEDGSVLVNMTLHDHGCGTVQAMRMIIAETLGIDIEQIQTGEGDTARTPYDYGCYSSRTTYILGRAAQEAARSLLECLVETVAAVKGLDASLLQANKGRIEYRGEPKVSFSYGEAAWMRIRLLKKEPRAAFDWAGISNPGVTGTHFAHVEVDTATGMVRLLDYLAVHDIGQAINREMCVAQIQGAVLMGSGAALLEHMDMDENGRWLASLKNYHVINAPDAPRINVALVEYGNTDGPFNAKSIGEVCNVPVAAAVAGAVNEALSADIGTLPLTPDTLLKYIRTRARKEEQE